MVLVVALVAVVAVVVLVLVWDLYAVGDGAMDGALVVVAVVLVKELEHLGESEHTRAC